jgi:outer membrane protein assembly factor BamB
VTASRARVAVSALVVAALAAGCTAAEPEARAHRSFASGARPNRSTASGWTTTLADWPFKISADPDGAFVIAGNDVVALDTEDGRQRWSVDVAAPAYLYDLALDHESVVVSAADRFVAIDRATGEQRWEIPVTEGASAAALTADADSAVALLTTEAGSVVAVDAVSGTTKWTVRHPGSVFAVPVVDRAAGLAAITWSDHDSPRVRVLDVATGAVRWEAAIGVSSSAPVIASGLVITGEGDAKYSSRIVARDLETGVERWSAPAPASFEPTITPGVLGTEVAIVDHFGTVTLLDVDDGRVRWQSPLEEPLLDANVLVTETAVVLKTYHGNVVVLDRGTGRVLEREYPGGYSAGVALAGGRLLVALRLTEPGRVVARPAP